MPTMLVTTKGADPSTKGIVKDFNNMLDGILESNFDSRKEVSLLLTYMDVNDCDCTIFFDVSKRGSRLWVATPGLTLRFDVVQHASIFDLSTTSNYHKGAGHVLLFTKDFDEIERLKVAKTALEEAFKCSDEVPKERALCFFYVNGLVCVRNYLIKGVTEIGPRLDLQLGRIFEGCFKGKRVHDDDNGGLVD